MTESEQRAEFTARSSSRLLTLLRPTVAIPIFIFLMIAATPIIYRSLQFHGIPPIGELVDREIDGRVSIAPRNNAFTFYNYAESLLPPIPNTVNIGAGVEAVESGEGWEVIPQDVRDQLDLCRPALDEWKLGTELDDAHYRDVADYSYSTDLSMTKSLRKIAGLAIVQSMCCLDEGKTDEAWRWLKAVLRSSRHVGRHGVAIERLVGVALHNSAAQAIVAWASHDEITSGQLREALDDIRRIYRLTPKTSETLKAEAIVAENVMTNSHDVHLLMQNRGRGMPGGLRRGYLFVKGDPQLSCDLMRHVFANYLSQCDKPPYERDLASGILGLYRPSGKEVPPLMNHKTLYDAVMNSLLAREFVASVSQITMICDLEHSRQIALELCVLFEMYRRKHGDYPETLTALVPEFIADVPIDWLGSSSTDRMLLVRRSLESPPGDDAESEARQADQPIPRRCLIIYGRGRIAGDGRGDLEYNNDVGFRIPLPQSGTRP